MVTADVELSHRRELLFGLGLQLVEPGIQAPDILAFMK
jgi:hypothetical protein